MYYYVFDIENEEFHDFVNEDDLMEYLEDFEDGYDTTDDYTDRFVIIKGKAVELDVQVKKTISIVESKW